MIKLAHKKKDSYISGVEIVFSREDANISGDLTSQYLW